MSRGLSTANPTYLLHLSPSESVGPEYGCSSPIRCARHEENFFLLGASSAVRDCRLIRRPVKDARRKREPCLGRVTRKRVWSSEKWLLSLRCDCITMVPKPCPARNQARWPRRNC